MSKAIADYTFIYDVLMDKNIEHQPFDAVAAIIQKKFPKHDFLSVGTLLTVLVRHSDLPGIIQRINAYYIMYDLFKNDSGVTESPFLSVFLSVVESKEPVHSKAHIIERNFVSQLLAHGSKDVGKLTAGHIIMQDIIPVHFDFNPLKAQCFERAGELPRTVRASMMNLLSAPTVSPVLQPPVTNEVAVRLMMESLLGNADSPLKNVVAPSFMSIAPPLLPVDDELVWLDLTNPAWHRPVYESSVSNISSEAKRLVALVFNEPLNIQDRHVLLAELEKDALMVNHIGLTPAKLPRLVENNPLVAIEILLKLMHSSHITEYLNVLVNMDMSLYSMEVVNRLTTSVDLPTEFVYLYISNCISTCETISDIYAQTRLVRLLCVLLQSLIRNKIINVKDLFIEVEAFCVEFSRIKEAAGLYRLLKQLEMGDATTTAGTGTATGTTTTLSSSSTTMGGGSSTTTTATSAAPTAGGGKSSAAAGGKN